MLTDSNSLTPFSVEFPNGTTAVATSSEILATNNVHTEAHTFSDGQLSNSLLSLSEFANQECKIELLKDSITITHLPTDTIIAYDTKKYSDKL